MNENTIEMAKGRWPEILRRHGLPEEFLRNKHGKCPLCGGKDRYRFDDKDGSGSYFCSGCGPGFGFQLLINYCGMDKPTAMKSLASMVGKIEISESKPKANNRRVLEMARYLVDAKECRPVLEYLKSRGLKPSGLVKAHNGLRYYEDGKSLGDFAAMVLPFESFDGQLVTYHVTYLSDGKKANLPSPKKILPALSPMAGGAIRLTRIYEHIGITEGIETALAVMRDFKIPCWAAASATLLEKFKPPQGVKSVAIFGDNDANFVGQRGAYALAASLVLSGFSVTVKIPEHVGDFADAKT